MSRRGLIKRPIDHGYSETFCLFFARYRHVSGGWRPILVDRHSGRVSCLDLCKTLTAARAAARTYALNETAARRVML